MITRMVRIQLVVFTLLSLTAGLLIFFKYARVPSELGIGKYTVTARFAEGAGIYPNANVTYRGVQLGKVTGVRLAGDGVDVEMRLDSGRKIPVDTDAEIHSVSAIGEQYVDLIPRTTSGPNLTDGSRIPTEHTRTPKQIAGVLDDLNGLLSSVPKDSLSTVLDEAEQAFQGIGPDLQRLLANTQNLVTQADTNYGPTSKLLTDAEPVLDSQLTTSQAIRGWTSDLAAFTDQLTRSDSDLRGVLSSVPGAANQGEGLLKDLSPNMPVLLSSSDVLADLGAAYRAPIEQILVVYPMWIAETNTMVGPSHDDQLGLDLKLNVNYPSGCQVGWPKAGEPDGPRSAHEISDADFPKDAYCKAAQNDPRVVRGARNLQCFEPGSPPGKRAATIYQCRGSGYQSASTPVSTSNIDNPVATVGDDILGFLSGSATPAPSAREMTWQHLLLGTLGQ